MKLLLGTRLVGLLEEAPEVIDEVAKPLYDGLEQMSEQHFNSDNR
jgi:hypothetical protein